MSEATLRIDVLGRGTVGAGLAARWEAAGHDVRLLGRADAVRGDADAVLVAVPAAAAVAAVADRAAQLAGRTVVDATNDVSGAIPDLAGAIAAAAPDAHVTKAFNTVFARLYDAIAAHPGRADMAWCGDDPQARATTERLVRDAGFRPVDCGPLAAAPDLEGFARLVIRTAYAVGRGPFAYRFDAPAVLPESGAA
ncbi:dinucleotide-binding protein [Paraconexibacter algicola]|uniref:dinucleotide-binding protein n=1 Tax=Paraconexibacter algicola TaxID=2133960 RepID=UPI001304BBD7|nr:dinucleotide-binding protein [Paraconexibacter algicola]